MVSVMPAQAGIHDFGRIDPQAVDGRNKPGHDGTRTPMGHSQGPLGNESSGSRAVVTKRLLPFGGAHAQVFYIESYIARGSLLLKKQAHGEPFIGRLVSDVNHVFSKPLPFGASKGARS